MESPAVSAIPEHPTVLCPVCAPLLGPAPLVIGLDDLEVACPTCQRHFTLLTRQLSEVRSERLSNGRVRYLLQTREANQRTHPRVLEAQPQLYLRGGNWITLLSRGHHVMGVANQSLRLWYPVQPQQSQRQPTRLARVVGAACIVLAALQLTRLIPQVGHLFRDHGGQAVVALLVLIVIGLAPAVVWAIQTAGGPTARQRRYLPSFSDDNVD
jgi:hypothetical protein